MRTSLVALAGITAVANAQAPPVATHSTGFNASVSLTEEQIELGKLSKDSVKDIEIILNFERTQLAFGGPHEDDFYTLPELSNKTVADLEPGVLLKSQPVTDVTAYAVPPNVALSRIMYTTTNQNGTILPATAFVLWPYTAKNFGDDHDDDQGASKAPAVLWAHGTSGFFANAAPSAHRSLYQEHQGPFPLAQEGYAVVAADFAGIGVSKSWDGSNIPHQWLNSPAAALDSLYALRAAKEAFESQLSGEFVVMGHSQGGGVAWGTAELLQSAQDEFADLVKGYRGTVAFAPTTDLFNGISEFILPGVGLAVDSIFPDFELSNWLTPLGVARAKLLSQIEGTVAVLQQLVSTGEEIIRPDYKDVSWHAAAYEKLSNAGNKDFKGPLLVIQGTEDVYVSHNVTEKTADNTAELFPDNDLEFITLPGVGHTPSLDATRSLWIKWIADRFEKKPVKKSGFVKRELESFLPIEQYLKSGTSFMLWSGKPEWTHELPLAL